MVDPAEKTFTVAFGKGKQSVGLTSEALTLEELLARVTTHTVGSKDGAGFILPGTLAPCATPCRNHGRGTAVDCGGGALHRLDANVQALHCLFVDLDKLDAAGLAAAVATVEASGLRYACYSTPSYAPPSKANARFVFPLAASCPASEWKRIWPALIAATGLQGVDITCSNVSRHFYLPTKPTADAPTFTRQGGTRFLEVPKLTVVLALAAPSDIITALRAEAEHPEHVAVVERIARGEALADSGDRHRTILQATMLLARVGAKSIDALRPSLVAMGDERDWTAEAERAFDTAPVEDTPEVVAFRELLEEQDGTDKGFAKRFVRLFSNHARHVSGIGWHAWDGVRWTKQADVPFQLLGELSNSYIEDHRELKAAIKRRLLLRAEMPAESPETKRFAEKLTRLIQKEEKYVARVITPPRNTAPASAIARRAAPYMEAAADTFDADAWALNCENGTLDLKTAALLQHDPAALCSKLAPVEYDVAAAAPLFERTLDQALPNPEVRAFFQRAIGYALTGDMSEHLLFLMLGSGGNGKSTLLNAIAHALGDYAGPAPKSLLMSSKLGAQSYELADLRGRRLVTVMELSQREYMDSSRLKSVVGGDRIIAARKYENQTTFTTQAKIFMPCNSKPRLNDDDEGAWRRIALIEFPNAFLTDDMRDRALPEQLMHEAPGILAWAVRGCLDWQQNGLRIPDACRQAATAYRHEENYVAQFVDDRVERGEGSILSSRLYDAYREWAQGEGVQSMSQKGFGMKMKRLGFEASRTSSARMWSGVKSLVT